MNEPNLLIRADTGSIATIIQRSSLTLSQVIIDHPMLVLIQHGTKIVQYQNKSITVSAGQAIVISAGQALNIRNCIADSQGYEAVCITWDEKLIQSFFEQLSEMQRHMLRPIKVQPIINNVNEFNVAIERVTKCIGQSDIPTSVIRHMLVELLIWLAHQGYYFATPATRSITSKVRHLISSSMSSDWHTADVANQLAMSEATLRRHLAKEGEHFLGILSDVRMCHALSMLQCTSMPITQIALEVGYESASRFTARFKNRFGFLPKQIRVNKSVAER